MLSYSDLSMILCDPHATNTITLSAVKAMQQAVATEGLPRVRLD